MIEELNRAVRTIREVRANTTPRMNVLDISGVSHLELKNSDIIAFLLSPGAAHKSPRIGELFLEHISECLDGNLKGRTIKQVRREQATSNNRYIDILIKTNQGESIIIENKVWATDSKDQLKDYIAWSQEENKAAPITLYLTPFGERPSEASLPSEQSTILEKQKRFLCISYKEHILKWLNDVLDEMSDSKQELLRSALMQYRDAVQGLCKIRKDNDMEHSAIVADLISRYNPDTADGESIEILQDTAGCIQRAVDHYAILYFLIDMKKQLLDLGSKRVRLTIGQNRYEDTAQWIRESQVKSSPLGIEIALETPEQEKFGLGLEVSETTRQATITFGVMAHGNGSSTKAPSFKIPQDLLKEIENYSIEACEWWWQYASPNSWFNEALFRYGTKATWQESNRSLVQHIIQYWIQPLGVL